MFGSLLNLGSDLVDIATAPVKVAAGVARVVTKPVADVANEVVKEVEDALDLDD